MPTFFKKIVLRLLYFVLSKRKKKILVFKKTKASFLRVKQNEFLRERIARIPNIRSVLNVGSVPSEGDKEGSEYRLYFKDAEYYTLDKNRHSPDKNHFNLDLHDLARLNMEFDLVLNMSVLEHVENPFLVAEELIKVVKKGGYIFVCTPMFYPVHKDVHSRYSDFWRFTDDGIRLLFKGLKEVWIEKIDSVLVAVEDRDMYWTNDNTYTGICALFRKEE